MLRWVVFSGKLFGGLAPLLLIVTVPRIRAARRLPLRVLRIAGRFRSRGSTLVRLDRRLGGRLLFGRRPTLLPVPVVRLDRRLGAGLLFGGCPTPLPAPIVGVFPICVVFPLTWLIRHDDSSLAEAGGLLPPKVSGSLRHLKRPETTATAPRTPLPPQPPFPAASPA